MTISIHECNDCRCSSADIKAAGGRCPREVPTTEPGALADMREVRPVRPGFPIAALFVAVLLVLGAWSIVTAVGLAVGQ